MGRSIYVMLQVRKLATQVKALVKKGVSNGFVFVDLAEYVSLGRAPVFIVFPCLCRFLPVHCAMRVKVSAQQDEESTRHGKVSVVPPPLLIRARGSCAGCREEACVRVVASGVGPLHWGRLA